MKLKDIVEKQKALDIELTALLDKEELTDEEDARINEIAAEQKDLEQKKIKAERAEQLKQDMEARKAWGEQTSDTPDDIIKDIETETAVTSVHERVKDDPRGGFDDYGDFALFYGHFGQNLCLDGYSWPKRSAESAFDALWHRVLAAKIDA